MSGKYEATDTRPEVINVTQLGNGLKLVATHRLEFTHEEAEKLLGREEFIGDRPLKNRHVEYLIRAMERGTFHPEWVQLVICKHEGKVYRMNGQHTAWARLHVEKGYTCPVTMLEYVAKSLDDVRTLYASIDRSSPRTRANVITSYLAGTEEFDGVKVSTLRVVPMGLAMWCWKTKHDRRSHDGDDVAYLVRTEHYDLARKVSGFLDRYSSRDYRHLLRAPVVGAMFGTFNKAPKIAEDFWVPVANGTGIEKVGDPRLKLRNELMRTAVDAGSGASSDKKRVSQEFMYRQCVVAWNAFRENRSLQLLKATDKGNRPSIK